MYVITVFNTTRSEPASTRSQRCALSGRRTNLNLFSPQKDEGSDPESQLVDDVLSCFVRICHYVLLIMIKNYTQYQLYVFSSSLEIGIVNRNSEPEHAVIVNGTHARRAFLRDYRVPHGPARTRTKNAIIAFACAPHRVFCKKVAITLPRLIPSPV